MKHATQITKREFVADGGLSNPKLARKGRAGGWSYWRLA